MEIIFEELNETGIIKLNRPKSLNALNLEMSEKFLNKLVEWEVNKKIKRVLLLGEGKHFCAGGDVKNLSLLGKKSNLRRDFFLSEYKLNYKIYNFSKPYLSIWKGVVMGGGIGLSIYGDYRVVTDTTRLAMPETSIGFFTDVGASYFLSRLDNNMGIFLGLTGSIIDPDEILSLGLGTHYCPDNEINSLIDEYIASGNIKNFKNPLSDKANVLANKNLINNCFRGSLKTIFNNLKKDQSEIALNYLNILNKKCPTSLAVTLKLLKKGINYNLKECLEMEYKLSQNMIYRDDFDEGINAVLILKHHKPKWKPSSINDIEKNNINDFFNYKKEALDI